VKQLQSSDPSIPIHLSNDSKINSVRYRYATFSKEILAELYGIHIWKVDDMILQKIMDFRLAGMEFDLYSSARSSYLS
jgi:hypothetical protein